MRKVFALVWALCVLLSGVIFFLFMVTSNSYTNEKSPTVALEVESLKSAYRVIERKTLQDVQRREIQTEVKSRNEVADEVSSATTQNILKFQPETEHSSNGGDKSEARLTNFEQSEKNEAKLSDLEQSEKSASKFSYLNNQEDVKAARVENSNNEPVFIRKIVSNTEYETNKKDDYSSQSRNSFLGGVQNSGSVFDQSSGSSITLEQYYKTVREDKLAPLKWNLNPHNFNYITNCPSVCERENENDTLDVFLLVMVPTAITNHHTRNVVRQTWGNPSQYSVKIRVVFLLGKPEIDKKNFLQRALYEEQLIYNDLVQEEYIDTYKNLTYKTLSGLKWVSRYCSTARYVLKVDDHVFVNMPVLLEELQSLTYYPAYIMGNVRYEDQVHRSGRWSVDYNEWPMFFYPVFCVGPAYIISAPLAGKLFNLSRHVPFFRLEDVYTLGFVSLLITDQTPRYIQLETRYHNDEFSFVQSFTGDMYPNYLFSHSESTDAFAGVWRWIKNNKLRKGFDKEGSKNFDKQNRQKSDSSQGSRIYYNEPNNHVSNTKDSAIQYQIDEWQRKRKEEEYYQNRISESKNRMPGYNNGMPGSNNGAPGSNNGFGSRISGSNNGMPGFSDFSYSGGFGGQSSSVNSQGLEANKPSNGWMEAAMKAAVWLKKNDEDKSVDKRPMVLLNGRTTTPRPNFEANAPQRYYQNERRGSDVKIPSREEWEKREYSKSMQYRSDNNKIMNRTKSSYLDNSAVDKYSLNRTRDYSNNVPKNEKSYGNTFNTDLHRNTSNQNKYNEERPVESPLGTSNNNNDNNQKRIDYDRRSNQNRGNNSNTYERPSKYDGTQTENQHRYNSSTNFGWFEKENDREQISKNKYNDNNNNNNNNDNERPLNNDRQPIKNTYNSNTDQSRTENRTRTIQKWYNSTNYEKPFNYDQRLIQNQFNSSSYRGRPESDRQSVRTRYNISSYDTGKTYQRMNNAADIRRNSSKLEDYNVKSVSYNTNKSENTRDDRKLTENQFNFKDNSTSAAYRQQQSAANRQPDTAASRQPDTAANRQPGSAANIQRDSAASRQPDTAANIQRDSAANIQRDSAANVQRDSAANIQPGSAANIQQDTAANRQPGSAANIQRDSAVNRQSGSAANIQRDSAANIQRDSAANIQQDTAANRQPGSAANRPLDSAVKRQPDSHTQTKEINKDKFVPVDIKPEKSGSETSTKASVEEKSEKIESLSSGERKSARISSASNLNEERISSDTKQLRYSDHGVSKRINNQLKENTTLSHEFSDRVQSSVNNVKQRDNFEIEQKSLNNAENMNMVNNSNSNVNNERQLNDIPKKPVQGVSSNNNFADNTGRSSANIESSDRKISRTQTDSVENLPKNKKDAVPSVSDSYKSFTNSSSSLNRNQRLIKTSERRKIESDNT